MTLEMYINKINERLRYYNYPLVNMDSESEVNWLANCWTKNIAPDKTADAYIISQTLEMPVTFIEHANQQR